MLVFNSCGAAPLHVSRCRLSCLPELHIRMYAIEWKCMFQFCENDYNFHQLIYMFIKNTMKPPQITQHFFALYSTRDPSLLPEPLLLCYLFDFVFIKASAKYETRTQIEWPYHVYYTFDKLAKQTFFAQWLQWRAATVENLPRIFYCQVLFLGADAISGGDVRTLRFYVYF